MADYKRPESGFRFNFGGLKTNSSPDSLAPDKYNIAQNIRSLTNNSVRTRPGSTKIFSADAQTVTDIRAYSALNTDNLPRFLARDAIDRIYLDDGSLLLTMTGSPHPLGVTMLPFRPNQSPNPYMYIANGQDYRKLSAPPVTVSLAGIAEPQSAPISCPDYLYFLREDTTLAASWVAAGTAAAPADLTRSTEVIAVGAANTPQIITDPGSNPTTLPGGFVPVVRSSVVTDGTQQYQIGQIVSFLGAGTPQAIIQDVIPALTGTLISIASIQYVSGNSGLCSIVTSALFAGEFIPSTLLGRVTTQFQTVQVLLAAFKRGAIIQFTGGVTENVLVLSATEGPDGNISIECSTANPHAAGETITILPTLVMDVEPGKAGTTMSSRGISSAIAAGTATITSNPPPGPLTTAGLGAISGGVIKFAAPVRPDDYFHISLNVSDATQLSSTQPAIRIMFDVNNGAANFTDNFYYFDVSISDLTAAVAGTQTQLGGTSLSAQRTSLRGGLEIISNEGTRPSVAANLDVGPIVINPSVVDFGSAGEQTVTGAAQWTEIFIPLTNLTRVGNDSTRTMLNFQAFRIQVIAIGGLTLKFSSGCFLGGAQPDTGQSGAPYLYRVVPRSSVTGAKGNPSPATRYGVVPKRQQVVLTPPSAAYDGQIDTWDWFRYGGTSLSFRFVGSSSPGSVFIDKVFDDFAQSSDLIEFDNFQPWPSIDVPFSGTSPNLAGTLLTLTIPGTTNALRWLPGTRVRIANQVYTLFNRPTLLSGTTYLLQLIENAASATGASVIVSEPILGNQKLPYMWGPDSAGTFFAAGDPLRAGSLYFCKSDNPDSCPDTYNQEITTPSEPLLGGEVLDGLSYVASPKRWWALFPNVTNPVQRYSVIQQPVPRGLAAPFGHCTDGVSIFFWAKDGIWSSSKGSLTDEDLYNLFPHEGVPGRAYTYGAFTIQPPDYSRAGTFRLTYCNYYLFAVYQDSNGNYARLVLDTRRNAWCVDTSVVPVSCYYHPEQQAGTVLTSSSAYSLLIIGKTNGEVHKETDAHNDGNDLIQCAIGTMEWNGGDARAGEQWGDMILDCFPAAQGTALSATPVVLGVQAAAPSLFAVNANRVQEVVSLGGQVTQNYLGLLCTWTDDFTKQANATRLEIWQPSLIQKPETITDRVTDWYKPAGGSAAFVQGFRMRADTGNVIKSVVVRDADTLTTHPFTPSVQHNGEQEKAYSFSTPFIAHMVRIESQDSISWRLWDSEVEWIFQPTPEQAETWITQPTSHGQNGYHHVGPRIMVAWASSATVTLTITAFDGQSPQPVTLPSTGGAFQKQLVVLTANKGLLFTYQATSTQPFQLFLEDFEIPVGAWRRQEGYMIYKSLGGNVGSQARI